MRSGHRSPPAAQRPRAAPAAALRQWGPRNQDRGRRLLSGWLGGRWPAGANLAPSCAPRRGVPEAQEAEVTQPAVHQPQQAEQPQRAPSGPTLPARPGREFALNVTLT
jgi:hypothetical protein